MKQLHNRVLRLIQQAFRHVIKQDLSFPLLKVAERKGTAQTLVSQSEVSQFQDNGNM